MAHAVGVDYAGIKLEAADADVDFEPNATSKESKIDARLHGLSYGEHTLQAATLTLTGPPSAYVVHVTATRSGHRRECAGARGLRARDLPGPAHRPLR